MKIKKFNMEETHILELLGNKKDFDFYGYQHVTERIKFGLHRLRTENFTKENKELINTAIKLYWDSRKFWLRQILKYKQD